MAYKDVTPPPGGKISITNGKLTVPENPILPFIRGDGTGPDIWAASVRVFDAAVQKAYGGKRKISWFEVFAGEAAKNKFDNWLPDDTVEAFKEYLVGIKGPLTTPVGGGIRSLNVALRQMLDLYVCLRPVQWFTGVPSPVKHPEKVNMVIFRENTEDIYAGIDFEAGKEAALKTIEFLKANFPKDFKKIRFGETPELVGIGIKAVSKTGTQRLVRSTIQYAITNKSKSVTIVHKGNIMKYTEGAFRDWAYELAKNEFGAVEIDGGPWCKIPEDKPGPGLIIKDAIADITLQQVLTRPTDFDVIATLNLNGDYLSDALAAQVFAIDTGQVRVAREGEADPGVREAFVRDRRHGVEGEVLPADDVRGFRVETVSDVLQVARPVEAQDAAQSAGIVRVDPVGEAVGLGREQVRVRLGRHARDLGEVLLEKRLVHRDRRVVHEAVRHHFFEKAAQEAVREFPGGGDVRGGLHRRLHDLARGSRQNDREYGEKEGRAKARETGIRRHRALSRRRLPPRRHPERSPRATRSGGTTGLRGHSRRLPGSSAGPPDESRDSARSSVRSRESSGAPACPSRPRESRSRRSRSLATSSGVVSRPAG